MDAYDAFNNLQCFVVPILRVHIACVNPCLLLCLTTPVETEPVEFIVGVDEHGENVPPLAIDFGVVLLNFGNTSFKSVTVSGKSFVVSFFLPFGEQAFNGRDDLPEGGSFTGRELLLDGVGVL